MRYDQVVGLDHLKTHLQTTVTHGRIAHAQLFVGPTGSGVLPLAVAYAREVLCQVDPDRCHIQMDQLAHPDLHFSFPVASNARIKDKPKSDDFLKEWRLFLKEQPYGSLADWYSCIEIEKKQSVINVHEAKNIVSKLSLKSYEGHYKILIIWGAEKLNVEASNKLLKLIEEPPEKTLFILITEDADQILKTITSRCQVLDVPKLATTAIENTLIKDHQVSQTQAGQIARQANGDLNKALQLLHSSSEDLEFEKWFVTWVRAAFRARGRKASINDLIDWSNQVAATNRETQKRFLNYCLEYFRQAMLLNYGAHSAVYIQPQVDGFQLEKFAPFVDGHQIGDIMKAIEDAIYHIERNGNAKVILTDLSIQLTRLLHKKV